MLTVPIDDARERVASLDIVVAFSGTGVAGGFPCWKYSSSGSSNNVLEEGTGIGRLLLLLPLVAIELLRRIESCCRCCCVFVEELRRMNDRRVRLRVGGAGFECCDKPKDGEGVAATTVVSFAARAESNCVRVGVVKCKDELDDADEEDRPSMDGALSVLGVAAVATIARRFEYS